ncbi:hypothetical protein [Halobacillus salinus]|uniref:hypothetical protein n=1 Tax=Halobacillus salinus TaxID=192814 RepID=UPI0009A8D1C7|nr:hypothetical protein [Halobacillus salinus]
MENTELRRLRKRQYRYMNLMMALVGIVGILMGNYVSSKTGYLMLEIFIAIALCFEAYGFFTGRYIATSDTKKLMAYEKERLGEREFRREKRMSLVAQAFVMIIIGFQYVMTPPDTPFIPMDFAWVILVLLLVMAIMMNFSMRSRAKRIDSDQPVQGKAVRKNTFKIALLTGAVFFITSLVLVFVMIAMI